MTAKKTGHIEHVWDLPTDDGENNYWVETDDGHSYGSFPSVAKARTYAAKNSIRLRSKVVKRRSVLSG